MLGLREDIFLIIGLCLSCFRGMVQCGLSDELLVEPEALEVWTRRGRRVPTAPTLACEKPPVYFCEEPPDTVPPEGAGGVVRSCDYRGQRYHEQVFRWVAGRGCLFYTPDFLFVGGVNTINLNAGCFYGNLFAPCLEIAKEDGTCGCFPFDPGLEAVARAVHQALLPAAHGRWERCFSTAADCCAHYMADAGDDPGQCATTFDGWTCWPAAPAGTIATEVCSEFAYSGQGPSCYHYSSKECYANGTWEAQTEYGSCSIVPRLVARYRFHMWALGVSVALCLPAVALFCCYRRLRVTRVALHRNLLIAIIVRNVLVIVSRSEIYLDELRSAGESALARHGWGCRALAVAERMAAGAVFSCMLVEGLHLHRSIAAVFRGPPDVRWLYAAGAVIAWAPVAAWAGVMWAHNDHSCWAVYTLPHVQWVLDAPRLLVLAGNAALLADLLRVLHTKLRNAENAHQLSTAKATLYLLPVFGSHFLVTAARPRTAHCAREQAYYCAAYALEAAQGGLVALLYCYANKEVHMLIKATYKKTENAFVSIVQRDSSAPRKSPELGSARRVTGSTALPATGAEPTPTDNTSAQTLPHTSPTPNDHTAAGQTPHEPKLHVAEIISIQASERLAEILDPVYETVEEKAWDGYDTSTSDYYGFTNASSVSIDCREWIRACDVCGNDMRPHSYENGSAHGEDAREPHFVRGTNERTGSAMQNGERRDADDRCPCPLENGIASNARGDDATEPHFVHGMFERTGSALQKGERQDADELPPYSVENGIAKNARGDDAAEPHFVHGIDEQIGNAVQNGERRDTGDLCPPPLVNGIANKNARGDNATEPHFDQGINEPIGSVTQKGERRDTEGFDYEDCEMLDEILDCMDGPANHPVALNRELLCPYLLRKE